MWVATRIAGKCLDLSIRVYSLPFAHSHAAGGTLAYAGDVFGFNRLTLFVQGYFGRQVRPLLVFGESGLNQRHQSISVLRNHPLIKVSGSSPLASVRCLPRYLYIESIGHPGTRPGRQSDREPPVGHSWRVA